MNTDIDELFRNSSIKISLRDLAQLENRILEKIISMTDYTILNNELCRGTRPEMIKNMRYFFINPEYYGIIESSCLVSEIFALTTKKSDNSHYKGLVLNNKGFGIIHGTIDIHYANKIAITYLNFGLEPPISKIILELDKDINNSENLSGTWKNEEMNSDTHNTNIKGTVFLEKIPKKFSEFSDIARYHPATARLIINNYKSSLLKFKDEV